MSRDIWRKIDPIVLKLGEMNDVQGVGARIEDRRLIPR